MADCHGSQSSGKRGRPRWMQIYGLGRGGSVGERGEMLYNLDVFLQGP